jgi:hypothetical protein
MAKVDELPSAGDEIHEHRTRGRGRARGEVRNDPGWAMGELFIHAKLLAQLVCNCCRRSLETVAVVARAMTHVTCYAT